MQEAVIASLDEDLLETKTAGSDRFVHSNYVMPLLITFQDGETPVLPDYKKDIIKLFAGAGVINPGVIRALESLDLSEVVRRNQLDLDGAFGNAPESPAAEAPAAVSELASELIEVLDGFVSDAGTVERREARARVSRAARAGISEAGSALAGAARHLMTSAPREDEDAPTQETMLQLFMGLLESDIAYFFLDRTRIRPTGFRIGEHVYALSLAPGEEVTLEQKTFTKRQLTFEEQDEQDAQFEIELASTLSTELQEGFTRQKNITDTWGLNVGKTGSYSSPVISDVAYGSFNTNHTFGYTKNITTADQETRNRSTKDSKTASAKVASKYRTAHKTTFKVATEMVFESNAKRVIKNPNALTPITLHYFKVLQRVEMTHERYGVRLGWMPYVQDPAYGFFKQIRDGKAKILSDAEAALPRKPDDPDASKATTGAGGGSAAPSEKWFSSEVTQIGTGAADGSMSGDVPIDIAFDDGWEWDGIVANIDVEKLGLRPEHKWDAYVKGFPVVVKAVGGTGSALRVLVHVGAQEDAWKRRMIEVQLSARFTAKPVESPLPATEKEAEQAAAYATAVRDWETRCDELRAQAKKEADDWEAMMLRNLNPISEIVDQLIKDQRYFPTDRRDSAYEIDLWQKLFDWERASYVPYPGWWTGAPLRDPTRDPSDFVNACWARLYLPVRVGMERLALRWMHRRTTSKLDAATEARFDGIEAELKKYRQEKFGGELEMMAPDAHGAYQEKYDTIATWSDLMPTDGTHTEVVQAFSMAADAVTLKMSDDASKLRAAAIASQEQDARLKNKAYDQLTKPASLRVTISADGSVHDET
jgi:hypothetical protein